MRGGDRDGDTPRGPPVEVTCVGGDATPPKENTDLPVIAPESAHLSLQGVYGDFPHHNGGSHLDGGIADDAAWQRLWSWLDVQSASWYARPSGAVGRHFTAILAAEWRRVLYGLCGTTGRRGRGSRSIDICIGRNFSSASRGSRQ